MNFYLKNLKISYLGIHRESISGQCDAALYNINNQMG